MAMGGFFFCLMFEFESRLFVQSPKGGMAGAVDSVYKYQGIGPSTSVVPVTDRPRV